MNAYQKLAISALEQLKGDDLYRAQRAFSRCNKEEMNAQYGESGKTRAQLLAEYEAHEAEVLAAVEWVRRAK